MQWETSTDGTVEIERKDIRAPHRQPGDYLLLTKWNNLIRAYLSCHIAFTSNKLMAVSGIAKRIQTLTKWPDSDYLAGLWKHSLPRRLLWQCMTPSLEAPNKDIPTWSWAYINGEVFWSP
jgi:hypothetical protein